MQTSLFDFDPPAVLLISNPKEMAEWGTFRDSLRAPVHGWFTYPAGFSYRAVESSLIEAGLPVGHATVYDPFMGSGTTNLVAKSKGYHSIGVEAHPFVHRITQCKMDWDVDFEELNKAIFGLRSCLSDSQMPDNLLQLLEQEFPELILKCFLPETLYELWIIRDMIPRLSVSHATTELLRTALICCLRDVSIAATGWPYIAPNKVKITSMSKNGWESYRNRVFKMYGDLGLIRRKSSALETRHDIILGDSRDTGAQIEAECADHIFTSPPYLNNFDYADRTRLEMYFMGDAKNWGDISSQIRTRLMTSATTQINRNDEKYSFLESFKQECPKQHAFLAKAVSELSMLRMTKGGKKSYDLMTVGYFNDMYQVLKDNLRILKPGSKAVYILGDSAPYGVHIPTDTLIGEIGVSVGFKRFDIKTLRERGGKWEKNPQRHNVMLRESVVTLHT